MKAPNVIDGPRGPEDRMGILKPNDDGSRPPGVQDRHARAAHTAGGGTIPLGVVDEMEAGDEVMDRRVKFRYRSIHANLVVLLYAEPDTILPGGKIVRGRIYQAKFRDGQWETKDNWKMGDGQTISHQQQKEWIEKAESFSLEPGYGGFWDADQERVRNARAMYTSFVEAVRSDPKLKEMLKKDLAAADFDVVDALSRSKQQQEQGREQEEVVE